MRLNRDKRELTSRNQTMLAMRRDGMTLREIAAHFGVSEVRVFEICNREAERQRLEPLHIFRTVTLELP
jgi:hypothetical protein